MRIVWLIRVEGIWKNFLRDWRRIVSNYERAKFTREARVTIRRFACLLIFPLLSFTEIKDYRQCRHGSSKRNGFIRGMSIVPPKGTQKEKVRPWGERQLISTWKTSIPRKKKEAAILFVRWALWKGQTCSQKAKNLATRRGKSTAPNTQDQYPCYQDEEKQLAKGQATRLIGFFLLLFLL